MVEDARDLGGVDVAGLVVVGEGLEPVGVGEVRIGEDLLAPLGEVLAAGGAAGRSAAGVDHGVGVEHVGVTEGRVLATSLTSAAGCPAGLPILSICTLQVAHHREGEREEFGTFGSGQEHGPGHLLGVDRSGPLLGDGVGGDELAEVHGARRYAGAGRGLMGGLVEQRMARRAYL